MATERRSSFRGKVSKDAKKSTRVARGYLHLPEGVKQYSIDEGLKKVQLDFLPYIVTDEKHPNHDDEDDIALVGQQWWKRPFKVHRAVGASNESIVCPTSIGKPCPICEYQKELFNRDKGTDKADAIELYPKERNLYIVVPKGSKKFDEEPCVWDMSQKLFQDILKETLDEDDSHEIFPDLREGETLELELKWKKFGKTTFPEVRHITFLERDEQYSKAILQEVPNLDEVLVILPYREIKDKFFADAEGGSLSDDDDDDAPPVKKKKPVVDEDDDDVPVKKKKPAPVEEDEDEPPVRKKKPALVDDDDDDPPVRKKKTVAADEDEDDLPFKKRRAPVDNDDDDAPPPKKTPKERCPHGHKFGVDTDEYKHCPDCDLYDECLAKQDQG